MDCMQRRSQFLRDVNIGELKYIVNKLLVKGKIPVDRRKSIYYLLILFIVPIFKGKEDIQK